MNPIRRGSSELSYHSDDDIPSETSNYYRMLEQQQLQFQKEERSNIETSNQQVSQKFGMSRNNIRSIDNIQSIEESLRIDKNSIMIGDDFRTHKIKSESIFNSQYTKDIS